MNVPCLYKTVQHLKHQEDENKGTQNRLTSIGEKTCESIKVNGKYGESMQRKNNVLSAFVVVL